jgi:hypothetical protein
MEYLFMHGRKVRSKWWQGDIYGVFLDFDEVTVSKQRLNVARVKLRTVRRGLIDTVLQLKVQGGTFDV